MATSTEAVMLELEKEGCQWVRSEQFLKKQKLQLKEREQNNPIKNCVLKFDHFENIHRLPKNLPVYPGAPNFRQVPGYLVFGSGQPTKSGFNLVLDHITNKVPNVKKIVWVNMRQEPVVYMNGESFTPRAPENLNENMEFPNLTGDDIEWLQSEFVRIINQRILDSKQNRRIKKEDQGKVQYFRDTYAEHPEDRVNIEHLVHLESEDSLCTLSQIYDQLRDHGYNISYARLPIVDEKAPKESDFDTILNVLRSQEEDTAFIFNCQMGKGRTTTGKVLACLVKDILYNKGEKSKVAQKSKEKLNLKDFEDQDEYEEEKARRGDFEVIQNLFQYVPEAVEAKEHLDHIIDLCGVPPLGTGLQNLRECIIWTKEKFDFEPKMKKPFWKQMSLNFIERYFYLICFTTYLKQEAPNGFEKSFVLWMDIRAEIREVLHQGMRKFMWK